MHKTAIDATPSRAMGLRQRIGLHLLGSRMGLQHFGCCPSARLAQVYAIFTASPDVGSFSLITSYMRMASMPAVIIAICR